ncbi:MAG: RidA family protein [Clostridiales bacterium]|nr:RidA family protein [Clostridiales bacterium]
MKTIHTEQAPAAIGPYSQAIVTGSLVFTSGQIPIDPATGRIETASVEAQVRQAIENLSAILQAAGSDLTHVVKTTCYLKHISDFAAFNAVYETYFPGKPARSCVEVAALPKGALVEIEAVAELC